MNDIVIVAVALIGLAFIIYPVYCLLCWMEEQREKFIDENYKNATRHKRIGKDLYISYNGINKEDYTLFNKEDDNND